MNRHVPLRRDTPASRAFLERGRRSSAQSLARTRTGRRSSAQPKPCAVCGEVFQPAHNGHKYCSPECARVGGLVVRDCAQCGKSFSRKNGGAKRQPRFCSQACRVAARGHEQRKRICLGCGVTFQSRRPKQQSCSPACAAKVRWKKDTTAPRKWRLVAKGEDECRNCRRPATHLHHIVPRSKSRAGSREIALNGMPLCGDCHRGWHNRTITLYRGCLRPEEAAFVVEHAGQVWIDKNYPLPPDVELVELYAATKPGELQPGWEERNARRVERFRQLPNGTTTDEVLEAA